MGAAGAVLNLGISVLPEGDIRCLKEHSRSATEKLFGRKQSIQLLDANEITIWHHFFHMAIPHLAHLVTKSEAMLVTGHGHYIV